MIFSKNAAHSSSVVKNTFALFIHNVSFVSKPPHCILTAQDIRNFILLIFNSFLSTLHLLSESDSDCILEFIAKKLYQIPTNIYK